MAGGPTESDRDGGGLTETEEDKERQMEKKLKIQVGAGGGGVAKTGRDGIKVRRQSWDLLALLLLLII